MSILDTINNISPGRKLGFGIGLALIVALTLGAVVWLASERYAVLFSDVNQQDASGILAELERMKVDYRLEQGGSKILVADNLVHETRLKLMGSGTPLSGGVGFEVFDNSDFGMTEFAQKINFQRALQGELTRTIMSLRAVKYARVHLVMPERGLFQQDDSPSSASVTLFMQPGQLLDNSQVLGIQQLVAAAVPGLMARQVTVSDQEGVTLSTVSERGEMQVVSGRLQQKKAVEKYLADKVNEVLSRAFGPNQAIVSVDVALNFDQIKTMRENIIPAQKGAGSVLRRRESNFASDVKQAKNGNTTTEVEYLHGRTVAEIVETPGRIERVNVGVLVPADTDPERYAQVRELVAVTVGLDSNRGDAIAVYQASPLLDQTGLVEERDIFPVAEATMSIEAAALAETRPKPTWDDVVLMLKEQPLLFGTILGGVLLMFLLLLLLLGTRRNKPVAAVNLSEEQRQQLLMDLQVWLMSDKDLNREEAS